MAFIGIQPGSTAEVTTIGGVAITSTAAELNILDGVTATAAELNILDGVTSTAAELNILDGVTATATELNLVDGSTADTVVNSKAVIYGSAGQITANELDVDNIQIDANAVKSTNTNGNIQLFPNGTGFTELYGNTNAGAIRFNCEFNSHGVTLKGPPHSAGATYSLELPNADGSAGQFLKTDGSGKLAFDTVSSGGSFTATASGTLANGDTVIINSDGTVSAVSQSTSSINPPTAGTAVEFFDNTLGNVRGVFDSSTNKVVLAIKDNNNDGKAYVGTVSGDTISFGSPVTFETNNIEAVAITFDSNANKVVICYKDEGNSNYGAARVGTVSGTSISFGTKVTFTSSAIADNGITFDSNLNKVVFVYKDVSDSSYGKAVIGTVSGTDISFGSPVTFNAGNTSHMTPTFDSSNNKVVIAYRDQSNNHYGTAIVGTVSGTSISFGTEVVFTGTDAVGFKIGATFDSTNNKVVIAYNDTTDDASEVIVGTVSGTSISFGTAVSVNAEDNASFHDVEFDSDAGTVILSFLESSTNDHEVYIGTVSGTSISFGTKLKVAENSTNAVHNVIYDSNAKKAVLAYRDQDDSGKGKAVVLTVSSTSTNLTSENFVGISDAAYSNSATATIQVGGSVDDAQSSLTAGQVYYVQDNGSLGLSPGSTGVVAGVAVSSTKLLVDQATRDANLIEFGSVFTLPTSDGSANQVLKTDGSGSLSFTTIASGGLTHLSTVTASGSATVDVDTTFDSTYDAYKLIITDMTVNGDGAQIRGQMKIGGSYITSGTYDFLHRRLGVDGSGNIYSNGFGNENHIIVAQSMGNDSHASANFEFNIYNPTDTAIRHVVRFLGSYYEDDDDIHHVYGIGQNSTTGALTGLRFSASTGTISGTFRLYGITKGS